MTAVTRHYINHVQLTPPYPPGHAVIWFGMGCFWGAERLFWQQPEVYVTAVGYAGGHVSNPTYEQVCTGETGHAEVVQVVYQTAALWRLLTLFWQNHDPTQGMRQGNDHGSQYRSIILTSDKTQEAMAKNSRTQYQQKLYQAGKSAITTEIKVGTSFYYAESYHQQYLGKNKDGYCALGGCGVSL